MLLRPVAAVGAATPRQGPLPLRRVPVATLGARPHARPARGQRRAAREVAARSGGGVGGGSGNVGDGGFWAAKPAWCQPWSILLTGTTVVAGAYQLSGHSPIVTAVAAAPIGAWWYLFLVLVPQSYGALKAQELQEQQQQRALQLQQQERRGQD